MEAFHFWKTDAINTPPLYAALSHVVGMIIDEVVLVI